MKILDHDVESRYLLNENQSRNLVRGAGLIYRWDYQNSLFERLKIDFHGHAPLDARVHAVCFNAHSVDHIDALCVR